MNWLTGHFLIALPDLQDSRFHRTVILICEHNENGALGVVINKPAEVKFGEIAQSLKLTCPNPKTQNQPVYEGGPVNRECGFVIHSGAVKFQSSIQVNNEITLTTSKDIIKQITNGLLSDHWLFCLGCANWQRDQLENELLQNSWLTLPAKNHLIFAEPHESRWEKSLQIIGITPNQLCSDYGHA